MVLLLDLIRPLDAIVFSLSDMFSCKKKCISVSLEVLYTLSTSDTMCGADFEIIADGRDKDLVALDKAFLGHGDVCLLR